MQNGFRRTSRDPPREANNFALRLPNAVICNESSTFAKQKNKMKKEAKNIK